MPRKRRGIVDVVSVAILTAPRPKGESERYEHASYGNELRYVYPAIKLWELGPARLEASPNPFDLALLAVRRAIDGGCDDMRIDSLKQLGGLLDERGLTRERSVSLYRFIEWMLRPESEKKLEEYKKWMEGERKVYITVAEEIGASTFPTSPRSSTSPRTKSPASPRKRADPTAGGLPGTEQRWMKNFPSRTSSHLYEKMLQ